jgi:glycosyltransferase involved in cell wall biosynthesis
MFNPKVSIVIPVYNWSNYLSKAIESALAQTYSNLEILVINDGSSDNWATEKITLSFGDKIIYYYKENWWVATALNFWIEKMTWEYFSWLSHDDLYYPEKIEEQIKFLENIEEKENIILSTNYELINENWVLISRIDSSYKSEELLYKLLTKSFLNWCTLLIPKKAFLEIWYFNTELKTTQDYHLWFKFMKKYTFVNLNQNLVKSRQHSWQDTNTKLNLVIFERKKLENFILNYFELKKIRKSYWWKMPLILFYFYLKYQLIKPKIISKFLIIFKKLWLYSFLSPLWRKHILKQK